MCEMFWCHQYLIAKKRGTLKDKDAHGIFNKRLITLNFFS